VYLPSYRQIDLIDLPEQGRGAIYISIFHVYALDNPSTLRGIARSSWGRERDHPMTRGIPTEALEAGRKVPMTARNPFWFCVFLVCLLVLGIYSWYSIDPVDLHTKIEHYILAPLLIVFAVGMLVSLLWIRLYNR
jgi:hypothetical protein